MSLIREDLFAEYAFCSGILIVKMLFMTLLTARKRFIKNVFANPEDNMDNLSRNIYDDPDIERIRRAHRNDLENILPWLVMTPIWLATGPSSFTARTLIRTFVASRVAHTVFYLLIPKQPYRALTFFIGYGITIYQAIYAQFFYL